jgi:colanic acid/amylovoran biosynthesis protein
MKILISHAYSNNNKGDAALLSVLVSDAKRAFPNADITVLTLDPIAENEQFEGVPVKNALMHYVLDSKHRFVQVLRACSLVTTTLLWAFFYRIYGVSIPLPKEVKETVYLYRDADLIIPVGGGYMLSKSGFINTTRLFFTVYPFLFSALLRKITINYAQSVGPFGNRFQAWLAKQSIKRLSGIIVRESISMELMRRWNIKNSFLSVDSGFSFSTTDKVNIRTLYSIPDDKMLVGLTVRSWFPGPQQEQYERAIADVCDTIIERHDAYVVFIPQVTVEHNADDDRESSKRTYAYMRHADRARVAIEHYDHFKIKALYSELDYLIGTRFHSVIFALTSFVPAIAIGYEYKTQGIMADLGLEQWTVPIERVTAPELIMLFDRAVQQRDAYRSQLHAVLPGYIEQSKQNISIVRSLYEREQAKRRA